VLIDNYGFDPKHGIETYNISQIKLLVEKNGPTEETKRAYETLKRKFSHYRELFKE